MIFFTSIVLLGLGVAALLVWAQRQQLQRPAPLTAHSGLPVSILKPLKGIDPSLADNLESFFHLDYPCYELIIGTEEEDDPALDVARKLAAKYPEVPTRIVVSPYRIGYNPKVNNLFGLYQHAQHEVILISDSNIRVKGDYLKNLMLHFGAKGVGLVSSPIRGIGDRGLGSIIEALQLNTFVMGGVSAVEKLQKGVCVVGKSMLMRKKTLENLGGFRFLANFLAEDQVCGEEVAKLGLRVTVANLAIDNVLGVQSLGTFLNRHLRWAKIRWRMNRLAYTGELFTNPIFFALLSVLVFPGLYTACLATITLTSRAILSLAAERSCGIRRNPFSYLYLVLIKDLLLGSVWAIPIVANTVLWRGHTLRIGQRSRFLPLHEGTPIFDTAIAQEQV